MLHLLLRLLLLLALSRVRIKASLPPVAKCLLLLFIDCTERADFLLRLMGSNRSVDGRLLGLLLADLLIILLLGLVELTRPLLLVSSHLCSHGQGKSATAAAVGENTFWLVIIHLLEHRRFVFHLVGRRL